MAMKKTTGNGTDEYGFSVLPAGDRGTSGIYYDIGCRAFFGVLQGLVDVVRTAGISTKSSHPWGRMA